MPSEERRNYEIKIETLVEITRAKLGKQKFPEMRFHYLT